MYAALPRVFRSALAVSALIALGASLQPPVVAQGQGRTDVIISFRSPAGALDEGVVRGLGGQVKRRFRIVPAIAASLPAQAIAALERNPRVERIEPDGRVFADTIETELNNSWGVEHIGAGAVHAAGTTGTSGIRVAVIDSGIACNHPELNGQCGAGYDFVNNDFDPYDDDSHGTHVAGTIAAARNETGVVGVAPGVTLIPLKVLDENGSGSFSDVIAAVQWAVDEGIDVTNNSYGSSQNPGFAVEQAFNNAAALGVLHIASAGNSGRCNGKGDQVGYPARYDSVVAVAATSSSDARACFSSVGPDVEIAAPGVGIVSTVPASGYAAFNGTSMASPHVAGVAALVLSVATLTDDNDTNGRADEARAILRTTAQDLGAGGRDNQYGYGLVDALAAVSAAGGTLEPPDDAVNVSVTTDQASYPNGTSTATATVVVTDETGQPLTGLLFGAFAATVDGEPVGVAFAEQGSTGVYESAFDISLLSASTHDLVIQVTENVTGSGSTSFSVAPAPTGTVATVQSVTYEGYGGKNRDKHFTLTMAVTSGGAPLANAVVEFNLMRNGAFYASSSGVTDGNGMVSFSVTNPQSGDYTTVVTGVTGPGGETWDGVPPADDGFSK